MCQISLYTLLFLIEILALSFEILGISKIRDRLFIWNTRYFEKMWQSYSIQHTLLGIRILNSDGLFKVSIQIQMSIWSQHLDQTKFKQSTLKTPEITNISTTMYHVKHLTRQNVGTFSRATLLKRRESWKYCFLFKDKVYEVTK